MIIDYLRLGIAGTCCGLLLGLSVICFDNGFQHGISPVANSATTDASSQTTHTFADGTEVQGGMAVLDDPVSIQVDGVMEDGTYFPHADVQVVPDDAVSLYITHYGPPGFPVTQKSPKCAGGYQIAACLYFVLCSEELYGVQVDGFCAVNNTPWDTLVYPPTIIEVEGHGRYLVMDHKDRSGVDIYLPSQDGCEFSEECLVWEVVE